MKPNETALVLSGSGGVGTSAIQVAKNVVGATVITTTSSDSKAELIKNLGADEVINYTSEDVHARVMEITDGRGGEVVLDSVGSVFWEDAFKSLALGGRYGICGVTTGYKAQLKMGLMFMKNLTVFGSKTTIFWVKTLPIIANANKAIKNQDKIVNKNACLRLILIFSFLKPTYKTKPIKNVKQLI